MLRAKAGPTLFALAGLALLNVSCGGGGGTVNPPPPPIGVVLSPNALRVLPDGTPASVNVTVTRPAGTSRAVTLTVPLLPPGVTVQIESPGAGNQGKLTFTATAQEGGAGTFPLRVRAEDERSLRHPPEPWR